VSDAESASAYAHGPRERAATEDAVVLADAALATRRGARARCRRSWTTGSCLDIVVKAFDDIAGRRCFFEVLRLEARNRALECRL